MVPGVFEGDPRLRSLAIVPGVLEEDPRLRSLVLRVLEGELCVGIRWADADVRLVGLRPR